MASASLNTTELLVRVSRRDLWLSAAFIALIGAIAIAVIAFPDTPLSDMANRLFTLFPIFIAIAIAIVRSTTKVKMDPADPAVKALHADELRQASLSRAYRNGLATVLVMQPLLAVALGMAAVPNAIAVMACATSVTGALVVLLSMLFYDR
jgi:hypothetical protein